MYKQQFTSTTSKICTAGNQRSRLHPNKSFRWIKCQLNGLLSLRVKLFDEILPDRGRFRVHEDKDKDKDKDKLKILFTILC